MGGRGSLGMACLLLSAGCSTAPTASPSTTSPPPTTLPATTEAVHPDAEDQIQVLPIGPRLLDGQVLDHAPDLSGAVERQLGAESPFGEFLDPTAAPGAGICRLVGPVLQADREQSAMFVGEIDDANGSTPGPS